MPLSFPQPVRPSGFLLRDVETRWQIVAFWSAIVIYELLIRPAVGKPVSIRSTMASLVAVTIAIVAMKVALEGKITH
ncbi:hypothetical protein ACVWYO_003096 [Sphingomonas sp. UYP23]